MSKFTPGPWPIGKRKSGIVTSIGQICAEEYAGCAFLDGLDEDIELAADAPALLEALEVFVSNSSIQANYPNECAKAEAIIAKHRGGQ